MTIDDERAARLAALKQRRAGSSAPASPADPPADAAVRSTASPEARTRRRHAAPAGRILAAGLSASAFMAGVTALAAAARASDGSGSTTLTTMPVPTTVAPTTTVPPVPPTIVVVQEVHHPVYVDATGKTVAGSPTPARGSSTRPSSPAAGGGTVSTSPSPSPAPTAPAPVATVPPPPPPPACSGSAC